MNNILLTGSTGFVGQRLIMALDANLRIISREKQPSFETIVCDFENDSIPQDALKNIDTVFHLAGFAHDTRNAEKISSLYRRVNIDVTLELAKLAINSGVKTFVFISSVKAGGSSTIGDCLSEESLGNSEGVYGKTKREAELKLLKLSKGSGMHVSIIRPSLVYGPNVKGNLKLMLEGVRKGWFPPLPKTSNKRSMIHVDDLVRAILFVAEEKRANGEIFIATDGIPHSSSEIYDSMCIAAGRPIKKWRVPNLLFSTASKLSPRIKYKIDKLLGNECYSSKKLERLGFIPKRTLEEMNETFF